MPEPAGALDGVLVADFSRVLTGPLATMTLGDLGADVIKVERPGTGDETRAWGPPHRDGESTYHQSVNRNKRSIALDLADESDRRLARTLAERADVLVENFRSGSMERFGLGYEQLREANPGLVYCSVTGFGSRSGAGLPGYDFIVQAAGGLMSVTGDSDGEPTKVGVALVDVVSGLYATIGILAALAERSSSGAGQRVEVNLLSSLLAALVNQSAGYVAAGVTPGRMGNAHPSVVPYETLAASDGPFAVAAANDGQFARLCAVIGRDELAADRRFADNPSRVRHREALKAELETALAGAPAGEWIALLGEAGVPCGPINDIAQAFALAGELGLDPVRAIDRRDGGPLPVVANPIGLSRTPPRYDRPPPGLGEHDDAIRAWLDGRGPE
jgi:crotonobetainyl-CoA:carnitine CoA-transferase CaiB-like acyl-CoA transferase